MSRAIVPLALSACALCAAHEPGAAVRLHVASSDKLLVDPEASPASEITKTENMLEGALRATLTNLVLGAGSVLGSGPGPWRAQIEILEWISPHELKGVFGPGSPGIAAQASLWDVSRKEKMPLAIADFPDPTERFAAAKPRRVLSIEDAAHRIADWITAQIAEGLGSPPSADKGTSHE